MQNNRSNKRAAHQKAAATASEYQVKSKRLALALVGSLLCIGVFLLIMYWGYNLGIREVEDVPIIEASKDPIRVPPTSPGGTIIDDQDHEVYSTIDNRDEEKNVLKGRKLELVDNGNNYYKDSDYEELIALQGGRSSSDFGNYQNPYGEGEAVLEIINIEEYENETRQKKVKNDDYSEVPLEKFIENKNQVKLQKQTGNLRPKPEKQKELLDLSKPDNKKDVLLMEKPQSYVNLNPKIKEKGKPKDVWQVQLSAMQTEKEAKDFWIATKRKHPDILGKQILSIQEAKVRKRNWYRVRFTPIVDSSKDGSKEKAKKTCSILKNRGIDCLVVKK